MTKVIFFGNKERDKYIISFLVLAISYLLVIFSLSSNPFSHVLNSHDSSMFLYFGKGIREGLVPYKDMFDHKGIVLFWLQYIGVLIGGGNFSFGLWIVEICFYLVTMIYMFKTLFFLTKKCITSSVAILILTAPIIQTLDGGNYSEEFALPLLSISIYIIVLLIFRKTKESPALIVFGIMGALTFFLRANMIFLWVVFCLFLILKGLKEKKISQLLKQASLVAIGGVLVCLVVIAYTVYTGSFQDMIYQTFVLNYQYTDGNNFKQKIWAGKYFFDFATSSGIVALIVIAILAILKDFSRMDKDLICVINVLCVYLLFNFYSVIMSGRNYPHYFLTMFPGLVVVVGLGINLVYVRIKDRSKRAIALLILLILPMSCFYNVSQRLYNIFNYTPNQTIESDAVIIADYVKNNTNPSDKIYVHNINANIYLLSDRYSNSRFFVLPSFDYNGLPDLKREFTKKLKEVPPKIIVLNEQTYIDKSNLDDSHLDKTLVTFIEKEQYIPNKTIDLDNLMVFSRPNSLD